MTKLIIVNIPAYNEAENIEKVIKLIPRRINDYEVKIQVIDDWSQDTTSQVAKSAWADYVIRHPYNQWVWVAFRTWVENFLEIWWDILVNIDGDWQFDPNDIPELIEPLIKWIADISIASRFDKHKADNIPWIKERGNRAIAWIVGKLLRYKIQDLTCGFRAYNKKSLMKLNLLHMFTYTQEVIIDAIGKKLKIIWIPVKVKYFADRKSRVTGSIRAYVKKSLMIIFRTVRDVKPLVFFWLPGLVSFIIGALFLLTFLVLYLLSFRTTPYKMYLYVWSITLLFGLLLLIFASIADMIKSQRRIAEENLEMMKKMRYDK